MSAPNSNTDGSFAADFHYTDPDCLRNPWDLYTRLQLDQPVARSERHGGYWILTRYADVVRAACDTATFASAPGVVLPAYASPAPLLPFEADPPRHTKYRMLLMPHFTRAALAPFEPVAQAIADSWLEQLSGRDRCDLVTEYVLPFAASTFAAHLGVPEADWPRTVEWARAFVQLPPDARRVRDALGAFDSYLAAQLQLRADAPGRDLLTSIATASIDGEPLTATERHGLAFTLIAAGIETTLLALGSAVAYLAGYPVAQQQLATEPARIPAAVEEFLRSDGPAAGHVRTLTRDVDLHGQRLRAGERVLLLWAAASHDRNVFADPGAVRLGRSPNRHVAFGVGPHRCIGAPLARLEMQVGLERLLARQPRFTLDPSEPTVAYHAARGPARLPVILG